jgi:hypothetical protein
MHNIYMFISLSYRVIYKQNHYTFKRLVNRAALKAPSVGFFSYVLFVCKKYIYVLYTNYKRTK